MNKIYKYMNKQSQKSNIGVLVFFRETEPIEDI